MWTSKGAPGWGQVSVFNAAHILVSFCTDHAPGLECGASTASLLPGSPCFVYWGVSSAM